MTRVVVSLCVVFLLPAGAAYAQGGTYNINRTNTQTDTYNTARTRTEWQQRQSGVVGQAHVDLLAEEAHDVATRIQWGAAGWGITKHLLVSAFFERDLVRVLTLRVSGVGGFTDHDHGREWLAGGEVSVWLHTRRLEAITERLTLDFDLQYETSYETRYDSNLGRDVRVARRDQTRVSETSVAVPGYRSRMIGAEIGGGAWWGYHRTREEGASRNARAFVPYAFAGFASGWIKSSLYRVSGYGLIGKSRYHRVFAHLMVAPAVVWTGIDVDRALQPDNFPIGFRVGVENLYGRAAALSLRLELMAMPAGGVGMAVLTLGFGSMFAGPS